MQIGTVFRNRGSTKYLCDYKRKLRVLNYVTCLVFKLRQNCLTSNDFFFLTIIATILIFFLVKYAKVRVNTTLRNLLIELKEI